jgi:hypothetical protein
MGNYTSETLSLNSLLSSTIGDELKLATSGICEVYAIAPEYQVALLSAGRAADAAYWLDEVTGRWATTTYFRNLPWYIDRYNTQHAPATRYESLMWKNMHQPDFYTFLPYIRKKNENFQYDYRDYARYKSLKTSALINEEVTRLADCFFEYSTLGKDDAPDMLALSYFAGIPPDKAVPDYALELQDTYFRLDKELEKLLNQIDKKTGLHNTVIFIASTGYFAAKATTFSHVNIPVGEFYPKRSIALLNMYLMAIYGQGNWVETYFDKQVFLNRKLIEDKQISLEEIQRKAANFLIELSGIQDVATASDIVHSRTGETFRYARSGYCPGISGDLLLEIRSGWKIVEEDEYAKEEYVSKARVQTPLIIMAPGIPGKTVQQKIRATQIAPSVCHILRICSPNAATDDILLEIK